MKTLMLLLFLFALIPVQAPAAADSVSDRQAKLREIAHLDADLKPLRIRAMREAEVIEARKMADESLRHYYEVLRRTMAELEPESKGKIKRQVQLRKDVNKGSGGSRAEDYLAASASKTSEQASKSNP